jgi:uncharacterized lipoprotein YddW (UPF0748 family)
MLLGVLTAVMVATPTALILRTTVAATAPTTGRACVATAPTELRGLWLATVENIDFPSRPGLTEDQFKVEYRGWLDLAQRLHFNALFVQVRPSGDAFWPSQFAPWSQWLTGRTDGLGPGWDPMAFMVSEAHARDLQFQAWFNPYRGNQPSQTTLPPNHALLAHPDWAVTYPVNATGSRLYFNPGIPEARRYVEDSILEAVRRYDIDGVHFDDFFYPYPTAKQDFGDDATFATYGKAFATKADWRRDNVDTLVREMSERIKAIKPWVQFGISPFGIWRNSGTDPTGSATKGLQSYDEIDADTRLWVRNQWVDYIAPQLYWNIGFAVADYSVLVRWWSDVVSTTRVKLYIGQADYRVGQPGAWSDPAELSRQMTLNATFRVSGTIHFNATSVKADKLGAVSAYTGDHWKTPALLPTMAWLPHDPPEAPQVSVKGDQLTWASAGATSYAVYKDNGGLVATVRGTSWRPDRPGAYCVAGLDRTGNQGPASPPISILK